MGRKWRCGSHLCLDSMLVCWSSSPTSCLAQTFHVEKECKSVCDLRTSIPEPSEGIWIFQVEKKTDDHFWLLLSVLDNQVTLASALAYDHTSLTCQTLSRASTPRGRISWCFTLTEVTGEQMVESHPQTQAERERGAAKNDTNDSSAYQVCAAL